MRGQAQLAACTLAPIPHGQGPAGAWHEPGTQASPHRHKEHASKRTRVKNSVLSVLLNRLKLAEIRGLCNNIQGAQQPLDATVGQARAPRQALLRTGADTKKPACSLQSGYPLVRARSDVGRAGPHCDLCGTVPGALAWIPWAEPATHHLGELGAAPGFGCGHCGLAYLDAA